MPFGRCGRRGRPSGRPAARHALSEGVPYNGDYGQTTRRKINMSHRQMMSADVIVALGVVALSIALSAQNASKPAPSPDVKPGPAMPRYNSDGALQLPGDYRQWIFVGSSLGLSYSQGAHRRP